MSIKDTDNQFEVFPQNPPNEGILFVDHSKNNRSGHLGHALVEYEPGKILAFYPNCSDVRKGHNGDGWMEYKRSVDGGNTWSKPLPFKYSKAVYDAYEDRSVMCEKAVCTDDGNIIVFNLECYNAEEKEWSWQPLGVPTYQRSHDGGYTWQPVQQLGDEPGRIWDAIYHHECIYVLELCNDSKIKWHGNRPEHHYALYISENQGQTFSLHSRLPFDINGRGYGTMTVLHDGSMICYVYHIEDEKNLDYVISHDNGKTWSPVQTAYFAKQIRNPQIAKFKNGFILHGRSGSYGDDAVSGHFVLYTSGDGIQWDEGHYLRMQQAGAGAYSNNLLVHDQAPDNHDEKLLIQASHAYELSKTNVLHWWLIEGTRYQFGRL